MSAPVLEASRAPIDLPPSDQGSSLNFIAIVRRRWPWVLVGLFVGVVAGLLAYSSRPAVYQSNAQLLIIKKRDQLGQNSNMPGYMEDYMATHATIIKSEKVLTIAAQSIPADLRGSFPKENAERVKALGGAFTVSREKDPNNPNTVNNVLNLSMKGSDPEDCKRILDVIINAYRDEIKKVYEETTKDRLDLLLRAIAEHQKTTKDQVTERSSAIEEIRKITPEDIGVLQARYNEGVKMRFVVSNEIEELKGLIANIDTAGNDKVERARLLQRLQGYVKNQNYQLLNGRPEGPDLKAQIQELEAQEVELSKNLGPNHNRMESLRGLLDFKRKLYAEQNPGDPKGERDGLAIYRDFLKGRLETTELLEKKVSATIKRDSDHLNALFPLKAKADQLDRYIEARTKLVDQYDVERLQTELNKASGGYQANELNKPTIEATPVAPKLSQSLLLGMAAGLLFGVGLAALAELSDKGFRSPADIRARLGLAVLGHIPPIRTNAPAEDALDIEPTVVCALRPKSVEAEAYRGVRTALYFNAAGSTHQMIQVTSPNQGDGKSTLAANLAVSIAQSGKRVLLVDCDMRRPRVHKVFRLADPGPGLAAVINGTAPLSAAIQRSCVENLSLLPCGKKPANPAELLTSPNFGDLIERLKSDYEYVILDTPPVLAVSDPSAVAPRADGVILVFRMTSRVRPVAERAREQLAQIGANIIGVVVNGSGRGGADSGYGYNYASEYSSYSYEGQYLDNYAENEDDEVEPPKKG